MQILIADGNQRDSDRFYNIIPLALPGSRCYICASAGYLEDFLENFSLDYIFVGSFGKEMSLAELIMTVREYSDSILVVHYASSLSPDHIDACKKLGCYAVVERIDDIETAVNGLKEVFSNHK